MLLFPYFCVDNTHTNNAPSSIELTGDGSGGDGAKEDGRGASSVSGGRGDPITVESSCVTDGTYPSTSPLGAKTLSQGTPEYLLYEELQEVIKKSQNPT